jgi:hypothetical protein
MEVDQRLLPRLPSKARSNSPAPARNLINKIFTKVTVPRQKTYSKNIDALLTELVIEYQKESEEQ